MSYRLMYRFWLDMEKPNEEQLADKIELLKNARQFTATIRDGIRLICDLRAGNTDVLFELFPQFKTLLAPVDREAGLKDDITRLERLILEQGSQANNSQQSALAPLTGGRGIKQINTMPLAAPTFDDDNDLVVVKKSEGGGKQATQNFIKAMFALADS